MHILHFWLLQKTLCWILNFPTAYFSLLFQRSHFNNLIGRVLCKKLFTTVQPVHSFTNNASVPEGASFCWAKRRPVMVSIFLPFHSTQRATRLQKNIHITRKYVEAVITRFQMPACQCQRQKLQKKGSAQSSMRAFSTQTSSKRGAVQKYRAHYKKGTCTFLLLTSFVRYLPPPPLPSSRHQECYFFA